MSIKAKLPASISSKHKMWHILYEWMHLWTIAKEIKLVPGPTKHYIDLPVAHFHGLEWKLAHPIFFLRQRHSHTRNLRLEWFWGWSWATYKLIAATMGFTVSITLQSGKWPNNVVSIWAKFLNTMDVLYRNTTCGWEGRSLKLPEAAKQINRH